MDSFQIIEVPSTNDFPTFMLEDAKQKLLSQSCDRSWSKNETTNERVQIWCGDGDINDISQSFNEKINKFNRVHISYQDTNGNIYICKLKP